MPAPSAPQPRRAIPDAPLALRVKGLAPALAALAKAGITTTAALRSADFAALAKRTKLTVDTLAAIHLQAEIPGLAAAPARALVTKGGIRSRDALATANVETLVRRLQGMRVDPRHAARWVAVARGGMLVGSAPNLSPAAIRRALAPLAKAIRASNPHVTVADPVRLIDPVHQTEALARMRGFMHEAGVENLANLGTYTVSSARVIGAGYHLARPVAGPGLSATATRKLEAALIRRGRTRSKRVDVLSDALWFVQNPVNEAIIIGSAFAFAEFGELVLAREVTSLVIITESLNANFVRRIRYEDSDRPPDPRSAPSPARLPVGEPDNNPTQFTPGEGNDGADGGDGGSGGTGYEGTDGDSIGPAPSVTIYVKRTAFGLPAIDLGGRPGGRGGQGQHGGHGGDGAAGRPGQSALLVCTRSVGHGGDGGRGGDGGAGGRGGQGATGGSVSIYTLEDNLTSLASGELNLEGGPGGTGGDRGLGGRGGTGGQPGEPRGVCSAKPNRVGRTGSAGAPGPRGAPGPQGESGEFTSGAISASDWDAAFTQPWIVRLDPGEAEPDEIVTIVAHNFTADTVIWFQNAPLNANYVEETNPATGLVRFRIPGGLHGIMSIQLAVPDGSDDYIYSQPAALRILPRLEAITPTQVVPGVRLTLTTAGLQPGAVLLLAGQRLPIEGTSVVLPGREENVIPDGLHDAKVVNPDGRASTGQPIDFRTNISVRIKAWRVFAEDNENSGASRTEEDIRELIEESPNPNSTWRPHGIDIRLDPEIGTVRVSADLATNIPFDGDSPTDGAEASSALDQLRGANADGTFATFDVRAVNVYFANRIPGSTLGFGGPVGLVVMEDQTRHFPRWIDAAILAHELGHVFGLDHVNPDQVHNLMLSDFGHNGTELTDDQAREAFRNAYQWHDPA